MNPCLKPWQKSSAEHLLEVLRTHDAAADISSTGVGKTFTALAVAQSLGLPCLIVCPKIAITAWRDTAEEFFGEKFSITNYENLRTGRSNYGTWANQEQMQIRRSPVFVCNRCLRRYPGPEAFDACPYNSAGIHCVDCKPRPIRRGIFQYHTGVKFLIFDEAHRCGDDNSLNAELLLAARRQGIPHLLLSATLAETPLKLRAIGYSLGLHNDRADEVLANGRTGLRNFYAWVSRQGCKRDPQFHGWEWRVSAEQQRAVMSNIRAEIIPARGVRVRCEDIPGFPEQVISADLIDLETAATERIKKIYEELDGCLEITKIIKARQAIELEKIPVTVDIARERLELGFSVGIFVNFRASVEELSSRLRCPFIDGTVTGEARDVAIRAYQANESRCLILNSDAAGITINLQDLDGEHPRFGIVSPPWSAVVFRQLTGRFRRQGGLSRSFFKVLFAAGTVETKMHRALRGKLDALDSLNDNDLRPPQNLLLKSV